MQDAQVKKSLLLDKISWLLGTTADQDPRTGLLQDYLMTFILIKSNRRDLTRPIKKYNE